jgi:hypothetical protein
MKLEYHCSTETVPELFVESSTKITRKMILRKVALHEFSESYT